MKNKVIKYVQLIKARRYQIKYWNTFLMRVRGYLGVVFVCVTEESECYKVCREVEREDVVLDLPKQHDQFCRSNYQLPRL